MKYLIIVLLSFSLNATAQIDTTAPIVGAWINPFFWIAPYEPKLNHNYYYKYNDSLAQVFYDHGDFRCGTFMTYPRVSRYGEWSAEHRKRLYKEGGIEIVQDGEYKRPLWLFLKHDTLYVSMDTLLLEVANKAKVIMIHEKTFTLKPGLYHFNRNGHYIIDKTNYPATRPHSNYKKNNKQKRK